MDNLIKKAFLVDVRTEAEFAEGHVDGSTNIPLDQVASQLESLREKSKL
jgi:rhodanese-related sulfurtransferase